MLYSLNVVLYYSPVLYHAAYTYRVSRIELATFLGHLQTPKMKVVFCAETPVESTGLHGVTFQEILISIVA
jgi:hypothetical protein